LQTNSKDYLKGLWVRVPNCATSHDHTVSQILNLLLVSQYKLLYVFSFVSYDYDMKSKKELRISVMTGTLLAL
jgi:hypothetical protein